MWTCAFFLEMYAKLGSLLHSSTTFLHSCQHLQLLCQHQHPPFPFTHSLSLFFLISLFSVDLWLDDIQLQNLMKCRWKEMCASKNITVKIKTCQQKVSQQNRSSFQITILESYKRSLTSCSHVPIDLEKSSLDILQKFSFCLPQN